MAVKKVLDLNTLQRSVFAITMCDEDKTELTLNPPTEGIMNELQALAPELEAILEKGDKAGTQASFELAATLLSCNNENIRIAPEELSSKYNFNYEILVIFFSEYLDFISEITNEKN